MNILTSLHNGYKHNTVTSTAIPGLVSRYQPTSLSDLTALTGQTVTLNGGCVVQLVDGYYCLRNPSASGTSYAGATITTIPTTAWSIACWLKVESNQPTSDWINITTEPNQAPSNEPIASIRARTANNTISGIQYSGSQRMLTGPTYSGNTWYHCCFTFDGSTLRLYVGGNLVTTLGSVPSWNLTPTRFHMMGSSIKPEGNCHGSGRDFRVYNRALTAAEVVLVRDGAN